MPFPRNVNLGTSKRSYTYAQLLEAAPNPWAPTLKSLEVTLSNHFMSGQSRAARAETFEQARFELVTGGALYIYRCNLIFMDCLPPACWVLYDFGMVGGPFLW